MPWLRWWLPHVGLHSHALRVLRSLAPLLQGLAAGGGEVGRPRFLRRQLFDRTALERTGACILVMIPGARARSLSPSGQRAGRGSGRWLFCFGGRGRWLRWLLGRAEFDGACSASFFLAQRRLPGRGGPSSRPRIDRRPPVQNGYLLRRGGGQNCWQSLVNCNHGDSSSSRFGLTSRRWVAAESAPRSCGSRCTARRACSRPSWSCCAQGGLSPTANAPHITLSPPRPARPNALVVQQPRDTVMIAPSPTRSSAGSMAGPRIRASATIGPA
jgi:hypothetical protein